SSLLQSLGRLAHGVLSRSLLSLIKLVLSLFHLALSLLQRLAGLLLLGNIGGRRLAHLLRGLFHLLRGPVQRLPGLLAGLLGLGFQSLHPRPLSLLRERGGCREALQRLTGLRHSGIGFGGVSFL